MRRCRWDRPSSLAPDHHALVHSGLHPAGQEGRLFSPLAFTKTYSMAAAAALAVTLIPVLMGYLVRGRIPDERSNPINRCLIAFYQPLLGGCSRHPRAMLAASRCLILLATLYPAAAHRRRVHAAAQ